MGRGDKITSLADVMKCLHDIYLVLGNIVGLLQMMKMHFYLIILSIVQIDLKKEEPQPDRSSSYISPVSRRHELLVFC